MAAVRATRAPKRLELPLSEELRSRIDDESEEGAWLAPAPLPAEVHWEGDATDDEEDECEYSDEEWEEDWVEARQEIIQRNAFTAMIEKAKTQRGNAFDQALFPYQRGPEISAKTKKRKATMTMDLELAAMDARPLDQGYLLTSGPQIQKKAMPVQFGENSLQEQRKEAIKRMEQLLKSKKISMLPQNLERHRAVLAFLKFQQSRQRDETREEMAFNVARCFGRGLYFARKIISYELVFLNSQKIDEGKRGCHSKTRSWFNDEGVLLAAREWISSAGERKYSVVYLLLSL